MSFFASSGSALISTVTSGTPVEVIAGTLQGMIETIAMTNSGVAGLITFDEGVSWVPVPRSVGADLFTYRGLHILDKDIDIMVPAGGGGSMSVRVTGWGE